MQIYHFWECLKVLELVKYRWEPSDFVKMILCSAGALLGLKQLFPNMIFLGSPMVMVFIYIYARTYEAQAMNLLGFFQIQCGWLPFTQMLQDLLQTGDVGPNMLGLIAGHTYFYVTEVAPRMELPASVAEALQPAAASNTTDANEEGDVESNTTSSNADGGPGKEGEEGEEDEEGEAEGEAEVN